MAAIGVAVNFYLRGDSAVGSAWIGRAARLLADEPDSAAHGYLIYLLEVEGGLDSPDRDAEWSRQPAACGTSGAGTATRTWWR